MEIKFHKNFAKKFEKLPGHLKKQVIEAVEKFAKNPLAPSLKKQPDSKFVCYVPLL